MADQKFQKRVNRARRVRSKLARVGNGRPRLSIYRSAKNISAQIIDDREGVTVVSASTLDAGLRGELSDMKKSEAAAKVGAAVAKAALEKGVSEVIFDRGGYMYHGRVKALADAARDAGLKF